MRNGKGKHLVLLHIYTDYKITDKTVADMTLLQYSAILQITSEIRKWKLENKPVVVI